ncbi:hypothetical protein TNIN_475701 [Trichonephila inaurata madagascariensis]|uniref:Uncharacterized protein n=1 Tax=Trichonephila inaurata madagascariensis TaxID=2747483 RepID=A0A8X6YD47_9ARAC|nr:hypothetical protein TNIN_475701 [Trichonephila inaurata madagascariensis]
MTLKTHIPIKLIIQEADWGEEGALQTFQSPIPSLSSSSSFFVMGVPLVIRHRLVDLSSWYASCTQEKGLSHSRGEFPSISSFFYCSSLFERVFGEELKVNESKSKLKNLRMISFEICSWT